MKAENLLRGVVSSRPRPATRSSGPAYLPLTATDAQPIPASPLDELGNDQIRSTQSAGSPISWPSFCRRTPVVSTLALPTLARFLADFTLGFADGLTVPFALTAGLSALGRTDTVVYAGAAEICAGCISMGVGGYLAARGEAAAPLRGEDKGKRKNDDGDVEARDDGDEETDLEDKGTQADAVERYLAPLALPPELEAQVRRHIASRPGVGLALAADDEERQRPASPVLTGLSIALGYLLGGLLPLMPYLFVQQVGDGLLWSFVVCLLALFVFGFSKTYATAQMEPAGLRPSRRSLPWQRIRHSAWEGLRMVLLGGAAALAAVLCVRVFESLRTGRDGG